VAVTLIELIVVIAIIAAFFLQLLHLLGGQG
jgi:prepilin-type N-terminal cleavage/methylation domain-containing protein